GADKKGVHPYCLGSYNAPAGRSVIIAARELMAKLNRTVGTNIYITGYSEGGANALWLTRYLEENNQPTLLPTRSAPMAGPYELSRATALSFISPQPPVADQENATYKPILITFAASATAALLRNPLATLIQKPLADQAEGLFPGPLADETLGVRLLATAVNDLAYVSLSNSTPVVNPKNLLDDAMVRVIEQHDTNDPGLALWAANDVVDWTPRAPVLLVGVLQDSLVPFAASSYPLPTPWTALPEPWET
ncbi:MAG: hypothetical protein NTV22_17070, partial [bacterium]|nr:hypothetical protein [bacterium]